jgi:methylamine---glutamate N-methyltransferase subunit A
MCGIVGLAAFDGDLGQDFGAMFSTMLVAMSPRGPDSTGVAWYDIESGQQRVSVLADDADTDWDVVAKAVGTALGAEVEHRSFGDCAVLSAACSPRVTEASFVDAVRRSAPELLIIGSGPDLDVLKSIDSAQTHVDRFALDSRRGSIAVGHTRMATESAVVARGCHPFAPGGGLSLVHNGSFSNYATVRADLVIDGVRFDSDNDSEVCARLIARSLAHGQDLASSLGAVSDSLDGFFTLLVSTPSAIGLVIDPFGCKPAVVAEHPRYVAIASEYHALAGLPDLESARLFEPPAGSVHVWDVGR